MWQFCYRSSRKLTHCFLGSLWASNEPIFQALSPVPGIQEVLRNRLALASITTAVLTCSGDREIMMSF